MINTLCIQNTILEHQGRPRQIGCPGARGYQLSWGGYHNGNSQSPAGTTSSRNASVITTLCAVHPFVWGKQHFAIGLLSAFFLVGCFWKLCGIFKRLYSFTCSSLNRSISGRTFIFVHDPTIVYVEIPWIPSSAILFLTVINDPTRLHKLSYFENAVGQYLHVLWPVSSRLPNYNNIREKLTLEQ